MVWNGANFNSSEKVVGIVSVQVPGTVVRSIRQLYGASGRYGRTVRYGTGTCRLVLCVVKYRTGNGTVLYCTSTAPFSHSIMLYKNKAITASNED